MKRRLNEGLFLGVMIGFAWAFALAWTSTYDTATPLGTDVPSIIDDRIREVKAAVQERSNVDHYWPLSGTQVSDADAGKHRGVTFQAPWVSLPAVATDEAFLGTFDVSSKAELHWKDEAGNVKQITSAGKLNLTTSEAVLPAGDQTITGTKTFSDGLVLNGGFTIGQNTDLGNYQLRGRQFYADVATGTAPLVIDSTTKVGNLNADRVDGLSLAKYDSGWFSVSQLTTYSKAHGLGVVPNIVTLYYSDTSDGSGDVVIPDSTPTVYAAGVCDIDATYVKVRVPAYVAHYYDADGVLHAKTSGYLKIVALSVL